MEFYDKLADRFQDLLKLNNTSVNKAKVFHNYLELSKEHVLRNMMLSH